MDPIDFFSKRDKPQKGPDKEWEELKKMKSAGKGKPVPDPKPRQDSLQPDRPSGGEE